MSGGREAAKLPSRRKKTRRGSHLGLARFDPHGADVGVADLTWATILG
jgi:hypothetical protein